MYKKTKSILLEFLKKNAVFTDYFCRMLTLFGLGTFSSKVAFKAGHMPSVVIVNVRQRGESRSPFKMYAHSGKDLVAAEIWLHGWDKFEQPLPQVMAEFAKLCNGTFLDVGANTGFYCFLMHAVNPKLGIHAFEPYPPVLTILASNLRLNNLHTEGDTPIQVFDCAVGEANGLAKLYVPLQDHGVVESSCSLNSSFKDEHSEAIEVKVRTLDAHAAEREINDVSMIKIDVEGFESSVLAGAQAVIERCRPIIFIEILKSAKVDLIEKIRDRNDYLTYRLIAPSDIVSEPTVGFDNDSWNHLMVPKEKAYMVELVSKGLR